MNFLTIRMVHETAVALSVTGFFIRGLGRLVGAEPLGGLLVKSLPHAIDTVLLLSALTLAWMLGITPLSTPWLMAKVCGLVVYIGLGIVAMRAGVSTGVRLTAWIGALVTVGWIISVAITKSPLGVLSLI
ncbi:MAG: SirB2 family protein [Pseudomonadota bacterium]|nr:SirB2 family protein [Pseudomonadota bacterium]